ncbi:MAG: hypothetical protein LBF61_11485 [Azoarcus sp.]|jgi:transcriptional regulator with GAF, ATPase, and Fis domain|nr:hypothetical protein [Azoarcus sp.]
MHAQDRAGKRKPPLASGAQGNVSAAATQLGLTRRMLTLRMRRYKLDYKAFRR